MGKYSQPRRDLSKVYAAIPTETLQLHIGKHEEAIARLHRERHSPMMAQRAVREQHELTMTSHLEHLREMRRTLAERTDQ